MTASPIFKKFFSGNKSNIAFRIRPPTQYLRIFSRKKQEHIPEIRHPQCSQIRPSQYLRICSTGKIESFLTYDPPLVSKEFYVVFLRKISKFSLNITRPPPPISKELHGFCSPKNERNLTLTSPNLKSFSCRKKACTTPSRVGQDLSMSGYLFFGRIFLISGFFP